MSEDLIKREDAIKALYKYSFVSKDVIEREIKAIPSADRPKEVIAQITFDEEKLREIVKEAVERFKEEYEIVDRPQGEWIEHWYPYFDVAGIECSICGKDVPYWERNYDMPNYCPSCGARMKGADDGD